MTLNINNTWLGPEKSNRKAGRASAFYKADLDSFSRLLCVPSSMPKLFLRTKPEIRVISKHFWLWLQNKQINKNKKIIILDEVDPWSSESCTSLKEKQLASLIPKKKKILSSAINVLMIKDVWEESGGGGIVEFFPWTSHFTFSH